MEGTAARPPSLCFRRSPSLPFPEALRRIMSMPVPPRRPDLERYKPDDLYYETFMAVILADLPSVKSRPQVATLIATRGLDDDDICSLMSIKMEHPYPLYRWFNGWLQSDRRDPEVVDMVGPLFVRIHRAMEKLPIVTRRAARAAIVGVMYVHSDCGGDYRPSYGGDLLLRWTEHCAFGTIFWYHGGKWHQPWSFDTHTEDVIRRR